MHTGSRRIQFVACGLALLMASPAAIAAPVLVQTAAQANGGNDASIAVSYAAPPTAGNLLIAIAGNRAASPVVTIPAGWTTAIDQSASGPGQVIIYKIAGPAEPSGVTITYTSATRLGIHIYEYSGLGGNPMAVEVASASGSGSTASSGSVTTTVNDELVLVGIVLNANALFSSWSNSFIEHNNFRNSGSSSFISAYAGASRVAASPGSYSTTVSVDTPGAWRGQVVRFQPESNLSGRVFEDANFAGSAAAWDGGASDLALPNVDVELYDGANGYLASTVTDAGGLFTFSGLPNGSYKVRVRSATLGDANTPPKGTLNACVPATCANPLPEMTWGNGTPVYGGQSPSVSDTDTGDDAGPGDTWLPVTINGANVTGVDFGFAYNLIVNTSDDANADNVRSVQGSLRQFVKNANAIGSAGSTTANVAEFRMQVPANQSAGGDDWWRVTAAAAMTPFTDAGTSLDGGTQADNAGSSANGRGPEIELFGNGVAGSGLEVDNIGNTSIRDLVVNSFQGHGVHIHGASAVGTQVYGCYIGTDASGENALPNLDFGIWINDNTSSTTIGSATPGDGNVISGNGDGVTEGEVSINLQSSGVTIRGNKIGTDRTGTQPLGNLGPGISISGANGVTIGGTAAGARNIISGNGADGIRMTNFVENVSIQGNSIGVGTAGSEINLGNGASGIFVTSFQDPSNIVIGGTGAGAGNVIAESAAHGVRTQTSGAGDSIQGNTIRDNDGGGIRSETAGLSIFKNLVATNGGIGIELANDGGTGASDNKVYQNTVHGNNGDGIRVAGAGVLIRNGIVSGSSGFGINVTTGSMTESDNLITGSATAPANAAGRSNVALDAGDLNLDPRYDNAAAGDFTLHECLSPAVEWGADLGVDQPDMNGAAAGNFNGSAPDQGAFETACTDPAIADVGLAMNDSPDPAPAAGPLVYTLIVTNLGPGTATNVTVTDVLPAGTTLATATPDQGSCSGTTTVICNLGGVLSGGTASVEIQVVTGGAGTITNNASVSADQADLVPGNNTDSEATTVVVGGTTDQPLTQYERIHGFVDSVVTGGTLRAQPNTGNACAVNAAGSATLSGIPATATVVRAYLYWAGSGDTVDGTVTFDGTPVTADRTFTAQFVLGVTEHDFFGGFENVTAQVAAKRNGSYSFGGLTVDTGSPFCGVKAVVAGWALIVIYQDNTLTGKTLLLYDGFDITRNGSTSYNLTGIWAAAPPEAKATYLLWEGDPDLTGTDEKLEFNGTALSDATNPVNNSYNSTINTIGSTTSYGVDLDTFDVSGEVSAGDTLATTAVFAGPDLVILNAVVLQVKSNIIVGSVFEDVNYGGGSGRDMTTAAAAAPSFAVGRGGARVELYDVGGNFLRSTTTAANGQYGFAGLIDGTYRVRCVNDTVTSSRPGAAAGQWPVQTFRTSAATGTVVPLADRVGGGNPASQDSPPNLTSANLSTLTAQSVTQALVTTGVAVPGVDFGFNFDTIVNTNDAGQGSLRQFILNSNSLTNANLAQDGLTAGAEHSLFMIPSDNDPQGRTPDPNFDAGRGVAVITPDTLLPAITDDATVVDGTTQTTGVEDSNGLSLGSGGTTGTDGLALPVLAAPEVEIVDDAGLTLGLDLQAAGATVRGVAIYGFGSGDANGNIRVGTGAASSLTGIVIEDNAIGSGGNSFTDPDLTLPGSGTAGSNVIVLGVDNGTIRRNLIGFAGHAGVSLGAAADDWTLEQNEIRRNGVDAASLDGIVTAGGSARTIISRNRVADNRGAGVDFFESLGNHSVDNNTIEGNGWGLSEPVGVRLFSSDSTISSNVIRDQHGAGVLAVVQDLVYPQTPALRNRITRNAFSGNGGNAIDLQTTLDVIAPGDGITLNDGTLLGDSSVANACGTVAAHGNSGLDTPVIDLVLIGSPGSTVRGRACPGAEVEIYRAVADGDGSDTLGGASYGEGLVYLTTVTAAPGTGDFEATGVAGLAGADYVTALAIDSDNNTSEFSGNLQARSLSIVKRAFQIDGTPIPSSSTLPSGIPVKFLLYIDNPGNLVADVSLQDTLDGLFAYQTGSIKVDDALDSATACPGGVCDDAAIFAAVEGAPNVCGMPGSECTDAQDADPVSLSGITLHAGDAAQAGNSQLDLPPARVWAMSFTIIVQ